MTARDDARPPAGGGAPGNAIRSASSLFRRPSPESLLAWAIFLSAVIYRVALFMELRASGFFRLLFVDNKATLDAALRLLDGQIPGPLMKTALWYIQFQAIALRLGVELTGLHLVQYLSGVLLVGTVLVLGRRVFGRAPSLIAGGILAFYGPLLFQESQLVTAPWAALFLTLAVLLPLAVKPQASVPVLLLSGLFMGLGIQSQANMIIAAGAFFVGLWLHTVRGRRRSLAAFALGVILTLLPLTANNLRSGEVLPLSALGGVNFFIGNSHGAQGAFRLPDGYSLVNRAGELGPSSLIYPQEVLGHPVSYAEASRFWTVLTLRHMARHPLEALYLLGRKSLLLFQAWEIQNNFSYYFFRARMVRLPLPLDFGLLAALALPWVLTRDRRRGTGPLLWAVGGYALSVVLFFVVDRYRLPLAPLAALAAGGGLVELRSRFSSSGFKGVRSPLLAVLLALLVTHLPGWSSPAGEAARGWNTLGTEYFRDGRTQAAVDAFQRALEEDPSNIEALFSLASIHAKGGELARAEELYLRVLQIDDAHRAARLQLGWLLKDRGDLKEALEVFLQGIDKHPGNPGYYEGAAETWIQLGEDVKAAAILERAEAMGLMTPALMRLRGSIPSGPEDPVPGRTPGTPHP